MDNTEYYYIILYYFWIIWSLAVVVVVVFFLLLLLLPSLMKFFDFVSMYSICAFFLNCFVDLLLSRSCFGRPKSSSSLSAFIFFKFATFSVQPYFFFFFFAHSNRSFSFAVSRKTCDNARFCRLVLRFQREQKKKKIKSPKKLFILICFHWIQFAERNFDDWIDFWCHLGCARAQNLIYLKYMHKCLSICLSILARSIFYFNMFYIVCINIQRPDQYRWTSFAMRITKNSFFDWWQKWFAH